MACQVSYYHLCILPPLFENIRVTYSNIEIKEIAYLLEKWGTHLYICIFKSQFAPWNEIKNNFALIFWKRGSTFLLFPLKQTLLCFIWCARYFSLHWPTKKYMHIFYLSVMIAWLDCVMCHFIYLFITVSCSIYERRLQAVPFSMRNFCEQVYCFTGFCLFSFLYNPQI